MQFNEGKCKILFKSYHPQKYKTEDNGQTAVTQKKVWKLKWIRG